LPRALPPAAVRDILTDAAATAPAVTPKDPSNTGGTSPPLPCPKRTLDADTTTLPSPSPPMATGTGPHCVQPPSAPGEG